MNPNHNLRLSVGCRFQNIFVAHFTALFIFFCLQLLTIDKIKHAERLRGAGDMRGSLNSALDWGRFIVKQKFSEIM